MYKISASLISEKMSEEERQEMSMSLKSCRLNESGVLDEGIVKFEKGEAIVDWGEIVKLEVSDPELYNSVLGTLYKSDILTYKRKDNHFVSREGVCVNPRKNGGPVLYFTGKEDANQYAKAERGNSTNTVSVVKHP